MTFTQALGGVLILGSIVGAGLLLVWQQAHFVRHIDRDDAFMIRDLWEGFRR